MILLISSYRYYTLMFHYELRGSPCWKPSIKGEQSYEFTNINVFHSYCNDRNKIKIKHKRLWCSHTRRIL